MSEFRLFEQMFNDSINCAHIVHMVRVCEFEYVVKRAKLIKYYNTKHQTCTKTFSQNYKPIKSIIFFEPTE